MITLIRWILLKQKKIKLKLAFWQIVERYVMELADNQKELDKKFIDSLVKIIHESNNANSKT